jgi:hypothetical protein
MFVVVLVLVLVVCSASAAAGDRRASLSGPVQTVWIGQTKYTVIDAVTAAGYIPNPTVRKLDTLIKACPRIHAYGFFASATEVGLAVWLPSNPLKCWTTTTSGGGPGSERSPGCLQGFRSADYIIVFAGTNSRICPNVSTQVPGGLPITGGQYAGWRVKCQTRTSTGAVTDYIASYSTTLPANKNNAGYVLDSQLGGGGQTHTGVPSCFGVRLSF